MATAKVEKRDGVPRLLIDGVEHEPRGYFFPYPVAEDIRRMSDLGVTIFGWGVWNPPVPGRKMTHREMSRLSMQIGWTEYGEYDFSRFDSEARAILGANPDAYIYSKVAVCPPLWWMKRNRSELVTLEDGTIYGKPGRTDALGYGTVSLGSRKWLSEQSEAFVAFLEHIQNQDYNERIFGYQITGGYNEWYYVFGEEPIVPDFSPGAIAAFRAWLRDRYGGDVEALRAAWKDPSARFDTATVPSGAQRLETTVGIFRDPSEGTQVADYHRYIADAAATAFDHFAGLVKKVTGGANLAGGFYGYLMYNSGASNGGTRPLVSGHLGLGTVLASPNIDFLNDPYQYTQRGPGGSDTDSGLAASTMLNGKLFMSELDARTFTEKEIFEFPFWMKGWPKMSKHQSISILKRDFNRRFIRNGGHYWMELDAGQSFYRHEDIRRLFRRQHELIRARNSIHATYHPDVAVIVDEESYFHIKPGIEIHYPTLFLQERLGLPRMGTPYDIYLHNDLAHPDMPDYRLYIFLNVFYLTTKERTEIAHHIRREGKLALWVYAPGYIWEKGLSVDSMRELTGIDIDCYQPAHMAEGTPAMVYVSEYDHPITERLSRNMTFGTTAPLGPVFYSKDPDATLLGRLWTSHSPEHPGIVLKELDGWSSLFVAAPNLPPELLREIARFAGCHIYCETNDIIVANDRFLSVHSLDGGQKRFALPRRSDVWEAYSRRKVARDVDVFEDTVPKHGTKLYYLGDAIPDDGAPYEL